MGHLCSDEKQMRKKGNRFISHIRQAESTEPIIIISGVVDILPNKIIYVKLDD
jgi:hypothetical protein